MVRMTGFASFISVENDGHDVMSISFGLRSSDATKKSSPKISKQPNLRSSRSFTERKTSRITSHILPVIRYSNSESSWIAPCVSRCSLSLSKLMTEFYLFCKYSGCFRCMLISVSWIRRCVLVFNLPVVSLTVYLPKFFMVKLLWQTRTKPGCPITNQGFEQRTIMNALISNFLPS